MSNAISLNTSEKPNDFSEYLRMGQLAWTLQVGVKPAVSCDPSLIWPCSTKLPVWFVHSSSAPINVQQCWGQVTVEGNLPVGQVVVSKLWGVSGLIILLQDESSSTQIKPQGGACLWNVERSLSSVRVGSDLKTAPDMNLPTTVFHCGFEPLWCHSLSCSTHTFTLLLPTLIHRWDSSALWDSCISYLTTKVFSLFLLPEKRFVTVPRHLTNHKTVFFWQDNLNEFCMCYQVAFLLPEN